MTESDDIISRSEQIKALLQIAEVLQAVKGLLGFVRDFSRDDTHMFEAIQMSAEAHLLEEAKRKSPQSLRSNSWLNRVKRLVLQVLQLMHAIVQARAKGLDDD